MNSSDVDIFIPDHAYIPGLNARHPEDLFDGIKETAQNHMPLPMIRESAAMAHGGYYLEQGYYWECHEVLEAVWMSLIDHPFERQAIQGVIQIANGLLKVRMDQPKAARRLLAIASDLLQGDNTSSGGNDLNIFQIWSPSGLRIDTVNTAFDTLKDQITQYNAKK